MPMTAKQLARMEALEALHPAGTPKGHHTHSTPPPDPPTRPFPAPVTTQTIQVSGDLQAAIDAAPDGSLLSFPASEFILAKGLRLEKRKHLVLDGNGATLRLNTPGGNSDPAAAASAFMLRGCENIAIRDFTVIGNNPDTTNIFVPGNEGQHVVSLNGWYSSAPSFNVEVSGVTASHIYGDFAYLEGRNAAPFEPSHHVWLHHNDASYIGRNHVSSISVNDLLVEDNFFTKSGGAPWDIEPNYAGEQVRRNTFRRNTVGSYGHMRQFAGWFVVAAFVYDTPIEDITVSDNTVEGIALSPNDGTARGLNSKFIGKYTTGAPANRQKRITFTGNKTARAAAGPVLYFSNVDGVTCRDNVQPLLSGSVAAFPGCTAVVT